MSEITKINGANYADIAKINGIPTADIAKLNSATIPASSTGASYWIAVGDDRRVGYITDADLKAENDWTDYDAFSGGSSPNPSSSNDHISVAYGKDENGDEIWVASYATDGCELAYKEGVPSSGPWTGVNSDSSNANLTGRRFQIQWGNDVWIAVGKMDGKDIFRSTNGKDWTLIAMDSVSQINTSAMYALASNGTGTWWCAQQNRIYQSTNDGQTWSLLHTLLDSSNADPGDIRVLAYTNATLFAGVNGGECFTAAEADLTDWSTETTITGHASACFAQDVRVAAAGGRVIAVGGQNKTILDIDGKNITVVSNGVDFSQTSHGTLSSISTDGTGTWCVSAFTGDMWFSTDNGVNFVASEQNMGSKDMLDCAPNVTLPL